MPYDPASGMWFEPKYDADGNQVGRDFRFDAEGRKQVDDRFDIDRKGRFIQVRDRVSYAPPGPPETWPDIAAPDPTPAAEPNRHARRAAPKLARKKRRP